MLPPPIASNARETPEDIRKQFLDHESGVRSIGLVYLLGAGSVLISVGGALIMGRSPGLILSLIMIGIAAVVAWVGIRLRRLDPEMRIMATFISAIGLLSFPIGTIVNAYFLYLLQTRKATRIFSEDYRDVIAATPHLKPKITPLAWCFAALMILNVLILFMATLIRR